MTRSPVYSLMSETLDGLVTIRAFGMQRESPRRLWYIEISVVSCRTKPFRWSTPTALVRLECGWITFGISQVAQGLFGEIQLDISRSLVLLHCFKYRDVVASSLLCIARVMHSIIFTVASLNVCWILVLFREGSFFSG